jgi:hypothetical protein
MIKPSLRHEPRWPSSQATISAGIAGVGGESAAWVTVMIALATSSEHRPRRFT